MPVYQHGDSVSNQPLTPPLPVVYPPQQLITIPSFSGFYYVVPIFQYWCPITLLNMSEHMCCLDVNKYGNMNVQQMCACKYTWNLLLFSSLISCDDVQQQRLVCASIIVIHCIKLKDQSLQRMFPKCRLRKYLLLI